ncbi:conserved hypothetical protein [Echinococcus multilocularis]|uniref:Uncharacterized protein n=1 Tax=Echinococcus multilocularis TaxID=6211 RepID=A0A068YMW6_ECHMU|nr:conserved hypothetical protein [Echinococcus multilocularis]
MKRVCRGPNQYRRFEKQPTTTNGDYGFEVLSQVRIAKAQAVGRALACCLPPTFPVIRPPCRQRPHLTNLVAVNPPVDYFIAPRLCSIRDPPYTPIANKREVKPRLAECRERNTNGTLITKSVKVNYFVAPRLKSSREVPRIYCCDCRSPTSKQKWKDPSLPCF